MSAQCAHLGQARPVKPNANGCEECLKLGEKWVELRMCLVCGHVGCCDSTEGHHATNHFRDTGHPIMKSIEPGDNWRWCYVDKSYV